MERSLARKSAWERLSAGEREQVFAFAEGYRRFLSEVKTEREAVRFALERAGQRGYVPLEQLPPGGIKPGTKFYLCWRDKVLLLGIGGEQGVQEGFRLIGAHIDSPRLDLKPRPLYEKGGLGLLKTHYYGGIKKYQWMTIPLALHGVVMLRGGRKIEIVIGEGENEPGFTITDLPPHLAREQMEKKVNEAFTGEDLNALLGHIPGAEEKEDKDNRVKLSLLKLLNERYGVVEEDLIAAELQLVPAGPARDIGLDSSFIGGYGQDDRVCAYTALEALLDLPFPPPQMSLVLLIDKEEIGSTGDTGAFSRFLEYALAEIAHRAQLGEFLNISRILSRSKALSADVTGGFDPTFENVYDRQNALFLGHGVVLHKYSGRGGKYEANDASAEYMGWLRDIFNNYGVIWQSGEMGRIEAGGGGTIAKFLAFYGLEVADCGPALLSMHSPLEISSKVDVYMAYKGYKAFFQA